jgi:prevent-host-death family protein
MTRRSRRVGVRELRQNLSKYLERVAAGETLEVCARGEAVAVLAPLPPPASTLDLLAQQGRVVKPTVDHRTLGPPLVLDGALASGVQRALDAEREDRA